MKQVKKHGFTVAATGILAIAVAAVLFTLVSVPAAASAATQARQFVCGLEPAGACVKVEAAQAAPTGLSATATKRTATVIPAVRTYAGGSTGSSGSTAASSSGGASAQSILASYIAKYPILTGATVSFGDAKGYQAICYYKSGRIVISTSYTRSLQTIIGHEIWHIIDWRDNGVIDWGENVPPR